MQVSVRIGPEFFAKAALDYGDRHFAFAREILQNSIDAAGCTKIDVWIQTRTDEQGDNHTVATISNNGTPMTREVLLEKLLVLGASGKNFTGANIGGYGKAKELLYYMHRHYEIRTGEFLVQGCGGECDVQPAPNHHGTRSTVYWGEDCTDRLRTAFREFAQYAQWSGTLTLDGEKLDTNLKKGSPRREFDWCKIYTNRQFENTLVVRAGGIPMFVKGTRFGGAVIVELIGDPEDSECPHAPSKLLTANRDGLKHKHRQELDAFIQSLSVDKRTALRSQKATYKLYEGQRLQRKAARVADLDVRTLLIPAPQAPAPQAPAPQAPIDPNGNGVVMGGIRVEAVHQIRSAISIGPRFVLKNTTGMDTPDYYTPGDYFSSYSMDLAKAWARVLYELYELLEMEGEFSIGFILDDDCRAEHEVSSEYGRVYYLNPAQVVQQKNLNGTYDNKIPRSFRKRYNGAWTNRYEIIALAMHEVVHGQGFGAHDEDFASKYTEITGIVLAHVVRFSKCFRD